MSLPREWSFQTARTYAASPLVGSSGTPPATRCYPAQGLIPDNISEGHALNKDPFADTQVDLGGSLFSIHSAPVIELNSDSDSLKRPSSLVIQAGEINTRSVDRDICSHISPPETVEDEDNDNLLTISSLTARPLIAKSHELRSSKLTKKHRSKSYRYKNRTDSEGVVVPPDGGFGWAVVFGAFLVQFWVAGLVKSYGVLFVEVMETFRGSSASVASWIPAILSALCLVLAPLTSALCQKFSCRGVVFIGGLFCALGLTISYFATSLVHLFFTFGVLTGIGGGLSTTPGIVMVSQYFDKHRALANGICVSGTAAGSFVFPLLIEHLCATFGFHGTLLLLGGCMLHVCVSATLYRPLKAKVRQLKGTTNTHFINTPASDQPLPTNNQLELLFQNDAIVTSGKQNDTKALNNLLNDLFHQNAIICDPAKLSDSEEEKDQVGETVFMKPSLSFRSSSILHSVEDLSTDSTCVYKARPRDSLSKSMLIVSTGDHNLYGQIHKNLEAQSSHEQTPYKKKTVSQWISQYLDLSLLKDVNFIMMCLSVTLMSTGSPYMLYYLPAYVLSAGFTKTEAGYLVAISAALDLCGRLGLGWLSDLKLFDRRKGYIGSILGAGVAVLVIPVSRSFYVLACSVGMYGLCLGCWFLLVPVLLADQYGTEKISSSYGLVRMFQSVGAISVPPLAGYMRDVTGGYEYCFYCMGTCMVLGGVPLLLVPTATGLDAESGKIFSTGSKASAETNLH